MSASPDFKTALVESSIISDITDQETFGVLSGPALSTYTQFSAISASPSQIVWNVQVPSESIVINRELFAGSTVTYTVTTTPKIYAGGDVGKPQFQWGLKDALNPFPLQSLMTTIQAQINNVSTSTNLQDVLPALLRMNDNRKLSRYNSMTPSYPDSQWGEYKDAVASTGAIPANVNSNPLASYNNNGYDIDFQPRGSFNVKLFPMHYVNNVYVDNSWKVTQAVTAEYWVIGVQFTTVEPFVGLSPFLNTQPMNNGGLLGINNMSIVANIDSTCKRLMGSADYSVVGGAITPSLISSITLGFKAQTAPVGADQWNSYNAFENTRLFFNFQTLQPEQYARIKSKNICGYTDYPRYLTTFNQNTVIASGASSTLTSQNIQLNQVPSLIMIAVRVPMSTQTIYNTSSFLQIQNISINFNSQSGLLASAQPSDLYQISARNGCNQSYYEWVGAVSNDSTNGGVADVPTTGSLLVLNPALDFSMPSFLSGGSLGQFSFQFNITVKNQMSYNVTPEIVIITKNDGLFVTQQGTSVIYTGILDKQTVLRTKEAEPVLDFNHHQRLVGGKLSNMGLSAIGKLLKYHGKKHAKEHEEAGAMSAGAMSAGAMSAGAMSAGRHRLSKHLM